MPTERIKSKAGKRTDAMDAFRRHRAERERLAVEKLRGELLDRATAMAMFAGWVRTFARGLLAVEGRMAHLLTDEQRRVLKDELRLLLDALSRSGQSLEKREETET